MLLTISTTYRPASDLSYLLHKHPDKVQQVEFSAGIAHIFYPEVSDERCSISLLLDIDPVGLVRRNSGPGGTNEFALEQYVNDRPYVASSFLSAALVKAFSTAMNGRCKDRPELVSASLPLEAKIAVLPVRGGEVVLRQLFEPLGYGVECDRHPLDEAFPAWGESRCFTVVLRNTVTVQALLSHLYILLPVCDNDKHYWVGQHEIEKLLEKGRDWLPAHPAKELITMRYLKHRRQLANQALDVLLEGEGLLEEDGGVEGATAAESFEGAGVAPAAGIGAVGEVVEVGIVAGEPKLRAHDQRLMAVRDELLACGAESVVDLGCGEGKLLRLLMPEKQFDRLLGMDVSYRSLEIAKDHLKLERLSTRQQARTQLIQGSLTYRDRRVEGFDAGALVEVIEHLDEPRLAALEMTVFAYAKPGTVVITTPNAEYNKLFEGYEEGKMRHNDHRFEWTRAEFEQWGNRIANKFDYKVLFKPVGEVVENVGALSQMAVFTRS